MTSCLVSFYCAGSVGLLLLGVLIANLLWLRRMYATPWSKGLPGSPTVKVGRVRWHEGVHRGHHFGVINVRLTRIVGDALTRHRYEPGVVIAVGVPIPALGFEAGVRARKETILKDHPEGSCDPALREILTDLAIRVKDCPVFIKDRAALTGPKYRGEVLQHDAVVLCIERRWHPKDGEETLTYINALIDAASRIQALPKVR